MARHQLRSFPLVLVPLALAACGADDKLAPADDSAQAPSEEPIAVHADCDPDAVVVGAGGPRVSRTAAITVRHGEAPADLQIWVEGPEGKHVGELFPNEGKTVFLPVQPYPADEELFFNVRMCDEVHRGSFRTGSLLRPVLDGTFDERIVGRAYALDFRVGRWSEPFSGVAERLAFALGGALLVDVVGREHGVVRLAVSAAQPDNAGGYARTASGPTRVFELPWGDNPYAFVRLDGIGFETSRSHVVLHDALLGIGFDNDGIGEAFLEARVELEEGTCALLSEAGIACEACANDKQSCVNLAVDGVRGLPL